MSKFLSPTPTPTPTHTYHNQYTDADAKALVLVLFYNFSPGMWIVLLFTSAIIMLGSCQAEETAEELYRRTVQQWQSTQSWQPWNEYTKELLDRWQESKNNNPYQNRLQLVGGFEEGILAIEKATVARGEGTNIQRDNVLSQLYAAYGEVLFDLTALECYSLALDPHTLLIGIETVSKDSPPSTYLCRENADNALKNSITLDATNTKAEELLQMISGPEGSVHERKPKEFMAELFDSFADTFDEKLVNDLQYVVPGLVGDAAESFRPRYQNILDAGCGTGLAGRYLKPLIVDGGAMIGVDASQKMLDIAAKCTTKKGCGLDREPNEGRKGKEEALYDDLLVLDLEDMTVQNTLYKGSRSAGASGNSQGFDLIVAADVLVYFGSLSSVLQTFAKLSTNRAGLIFSCERATEEEAPLGWRLLASGRFSHTKQHALEAASSAGYDLVSYEEIVPRMERGEEVDGHLFTFVLKVDEHNEL